MEDSGKSSQHGVPLLLHGGKITADAAKRGGSAGAAKRARDLLLHFGPAQVPLGQVVGKRNAQVVEQGQHLFGTRHERIQQIPGGALLGSAFAFASRSDRWRWLSRIASCQNLEIACDPVVALKRGNGVQVAQTPVLARLMQREQEVVHVAGPRLMHLLGHCRTIAQQVGSTDAVRTVIGIIAGKAVMHPAPAKARPDADLVHGLSASRPMPGQMREEAGTVHMQPLQHPIHADTCLISLLQGASRDQISNALNRRGQSLGGQFTPLKQGGFRDLTPTHRAERLAGARRGQQLSLVQIHRQRLQVGSILHRGADRSGKPATADGVALGTTDGFQPMLAGPQADFRHVQHLTAFDDAAWGSTKTLPALAADLGTVRHHFIRLLRLHERLSSVSRLATWTLAARTTRTARQSPQSIGRGRLTARATVFAQAVFQFLDAGLRQRQLLFHGEQLPYQRFEGAIFFPQGLQFFVLRHRGTLLDFLSFGKSLGDLSSYDGLLLIDEFENGLYYTVQPEIWRFIFRVARSLNIQVFATTHSWDCIEAFQQAAQEDGNDEEALLIRLESKLDAIDATLYDKKTLGIATRDHIEVR